jgi:hypothetical protein
VLSVVVDLNNGSVCSIIMCVMWHVDSITLVHIDLYLCEGKTLSSIIYF